MLDEHRMHRRQFAGKLATGSGTVAALLAAQSISAGDDPSKPKDKPKPEEANERPVEPPMEFLLLTYLMQRYPSDHFDAEAMRGIFGDLRGDVARGRVLSGFPLQNSDEPAFVFQAYRSPE